MWRLIGITTDDNNCSKAEVEAIIHLLEDGKLDLFHIRKPFMDAKQTRDYLSLFPAAMRERLALHDHYNLAAEMGIGGININNRNSEIDISYWNGRLSFSCHSVEEVAFFKSKADYVLLSPIFDSNSKPEYKSAFTLGQLQNAKQQGTIDQKVIALGGVSEERFEVLKALGFGGAALLGSLWKK